VRRISVVEGEYRFAIHFFNRRKAPILSLVMTSAEKRRVERNLSDIVTRPSRLPESWC
jgi:hypothetical protein